MEKMIVPGAINIITKYCSVNDWKADGKIME